MNRDELGTAGLAWSLSYRCFPGFRYRSLPHLRLGFHLNCHILLSCFLHLIQAAFLGLILPFIVILLPIILICYYSFAKVPSLPRYVFWGVDAPLLSVHLPGLDILFEGDHGFFSCIAAVAQASARGQH